jgi:hypothetical protein
MTVDRLPRPAASGVTDAARGAILRRVHEDLGLNAPRVVSLHTEADHLADTRALFLDVERRYALKTGTMHNLVFRRIVAATGIGSVAGSRAVGPMVYEEQGAGFVLLALPGTEFLTAIENAVALAHEKRLFGIFPDAGWFDRDRRDAMADTFFSYADDALAAHGAPYQRADGEWMFEWVGDPGQHELTVQPALLALADPRLAGARSEFEEALLKRRMGTPKELEDVLDEAAKAVESVLKVLHDECGVTRPRQQQALSLFNTLTPEILPGYSLNLVTAAAGPRNHMASHGQGAVVREVPEELADASIAAAATAITFLAHYLP